MEQPEERKWDKITPEGLYTIIQYLKTNFDAELSHKVIELFHERMRDDIESPRVSWRPQLLRR